MRVLVADDDSDRVDDMVRGLREYGVGSEGVSEVKEALQEAASGRFDAVVCDFVWHSGPHEGEQKRPGYWGYPIMCAARGRRPPAGVVHASTWAPFRHPGVRVVRSWDSRRVHAVLQDAHGTLRDDPDWCDVTSQVAVDGCPWNVLGAAGDVPPTDWRQVVEQLERTEIVGLLANQSSTVARALASLRDSLDQDEDQVTWAAAIRGLRAAIFPGL